MKKTILSLLLMSITMAGFCHVVTNGCWSNGRFKILASNMPIGKTCTVKLIANTGNWDTTFQVTSPNFNFTVPQPNRMNPVKVKVTTSDGYNVEMWTTSGMCSLLPLRFGAFKVEDLGDRMVKVSCTTYDETDMDKINITMSRDGLTFKVVLVLSPNNRNMEYTYTGIIDLKKEQL